MNYIIRCATINDYPQLINLWNSIPNSKRALNPIDDSEQGIAKYLKRNPTTCFVAEVKSEINSTLSFDSKIVGVILAGHDGRRGIIHHMAVHPDFRRNGIASCLVKKSEESLIKEGIQKILLLVFSDNDIANSFWEKQGYSLRTNLNYRNKSLNSSIPVGE